MIVRCEELVIREHMRGSSTVQQNTLNKLTQSCHKYMTNLLTTRRLNIINGNICGAARLGSLKLTLLWAFRTPMSLFIAYIAC